MPEACTGGATISLIVVPDLGDGAEDPFDLLRGVPSTDGVGVDEATRRGRAGGTGGGGGVCLLGFQTQYGLTGISGDFQSQSSYPCP